MTKGRVLPADCRTMVEVRDGVDRLDEQIVRLLAERFRYMDAAARIKTDRTAVRDEWRKADVLTKARFHGAQEMAPVGRIETVYEALIESSIAHEFDQWDAIRSSGNAG
ncbi:MAG TPA: chorismate mutase [Allosphingosinicella sp.]|uniref:chorismate mutase n=1 Tax=Allosphingosinicella sp. TaxID=2823234 RepID=UPI002ED78037